MPPLTRILLAEDSDHDVELTLAALEEYNLANEVVVVILDLKMPKVDGLEVLRQMKADSNLKQVPVVMLTSSREEQDLVRSYQMGVNAYVVKPVDFQKFVNSIKQVGFFWAIINEPPPPTVKRS